MIMESAQRMGSLIDDLLAFSRIGRAETRHTSVSLEQLAQEAVTEIRQDTGGRDIVWRVGALPAVYGDRSMLRLAFVNLIANAVKFTRTRAQAEIEIGCTGDQSPNQVVVFVRDNGVGFNMKYVNKLFGVFQRLHPAEAFEGTGIGLATVQRIVHRHGGRVWAEGLVDQGATFFSHFQVLIARSLKYEYPGTYLDGRRRPKDVELTLTALEEYNLANEVVVTRDGEEALDYLYCRGNFSTRPNDNPAVILLDLKLQKVHGLEVLEQVKSDEKLRMIPVVVLTSSAKK